MKLFRKQKHLCAVCNGKSMGISEIPDEVFSSGMLGVGFAVEPEDREFYSPVDGSVVNITDTGHAYSIHSDDGLDVLVHIGVDTVNMRGEGFEAMVKEGEHVSAGTPIARADIDLIHSKGFPAITAVLVTCPEKIEDIEYKFGNVSGGKDAVMLFRMRKG